MKQRRAYEKEFGRGELVGTTCVGPECTRGAVVHRMCNSHYYQKRRGNELSPLKPYGLRTKR